MRRYRFVHSLGASVIVLGLVAHPGAAFAQLSGDLEARVAALEAREAIRELIYAYGRALDTRDFRAFSALFDPEMGTWVGGFGTATGSDEIFRLMDEEIGHSDPPAEPRSHHIFTNVQIDVDGDRATATTKWTFVMPSASGEPRWIYLGHYDDEFIRRGDRWLFLRREAFTDIPAQ